MGRALILEFVKAEQAEACLDAIHAVMAARMKDAGYHIMNMGKDVHLVGRNALTGDGNSSPAARTIMWDVVRKSAEGTFCFFSPRHDCRFDDIMTQISDYPFTEKEMPADWYDAEEARPPEGIIRRLVSRIFSKSLFAGLPFFSDRNQQSSH